LKVTWGLEHVAHNPKTAITLGSFDGIHLGHIKILEELKRTKEKLGLDRTLLLTFHPHPQQVLKRNNSSIQLLTTIEERLEQLAKHGIDEVGIIQFSVEFAKTTYEEFFRNTLIDQIGTKAIVVGFNHAFGKNREGDIEHVRSLASGLAVEVIEVPPLIVNDVSISSTKIRNALLEGDIATANSYLGYPYTLCGKVIEGDKLGRELGYPTANLEIDPVKLIPADGVYAATVDIEGNTYKGALSIGTRPTVDGAHDRRIEVHLLDFSGDLYGKQLKFEVLQYIRAQEKFSSLEELTAQIARDVEQIRAIHSIMA